MSNQPDHFDNALQDDEVGHHGDARHDDDAEYVVDNEDPPKKKFNVPTPVLIGLAAAISIGGMFTYKKLIAPQPAGRSSYVAESPKPLPPEGMMAANVPVANAAPTSSPQAFDAPPPQPQANGTETVLPGTAAASPANGSSTRDLVADHASSTGKAQAETVVKSAGRSISPAEWMALNEKDQEIARLKDELEKARNAAKGNGTDGMRAAHAVASSGAPKVKPVRVANVASTTKSEKAARKTSEDAEVRDSLQLGYRIKQIVPGQAWIENEAGKLQIVGVGDKLAGSEVVKIDAENYRIQTTAGVIK